MDKSKKKNKKEKEKSQKKRSSNRRNEADPALDKKKSTSSSSFKKLFNKFTKKKKKTEESEYATLGAVGGHLTRKHVIPRDIPVNYNPQVSQPENERVYAPLSTCESDRSFSVGLHDSTHRSSVESLTSWHINMNNSDVYQRLPSPTTKPTVVHYHLNIQNCDGLQIHMENSKPSCRIRKDLQRAGSNPGTDVQGVSWIMTPGSSQQADLDTTNTSEFFKRNSVSQHNVASAVSERTLTPQSPGCGPAPTQKTVTGVNNDCAFVNPVSQSSSKGQGQEVMKVQGQEVVKVQGQEVMKVQEACQSSCGIIGVSRSHNDNDLASVPCLPVQSKVSVSRSLSVSNVKTMKNAGFTKANVSTSHPLLNQVDGMQPVVGVALANPVLSADALHEKKGSRDMGSVTGSVAPNDLKTSVVAKVCASQASENNESIFSGNMNCESSDRQANRCSVISKDVSLRSHTNSTCNSDIHSDIRKVGVNHTNYTTQIIQNPAESCNVTHDGVVKSSDDVNKSQTRRKQRSSAQNSGLMLDHANTATQTSLPRPKNTSDISDSSTQTTLPRKGSSVKNADSSTQTTLPRKEQILVVAASITQNEPKTLCASVGQINPMSPTSIPSLPVAMATASSISISARTAQTTSVTMPTNSTTDATRGHAVISTSAAVPAVIPTLDAVAMGEMSATVVTVSSSGAMPVAVLQSVSAQPAPRTTLTTSNTGRIPVTVPVSSGARARVSVAMTRVTSGASARVPFTMTTVPSGASTRLPVAMTTVSSCASAGMSGAMTTVPSGTSVGVTVSMPTVPTGAVAMSSPALQTMLSSSGTQAVTRCSAPISPGSGSSRVSTTAVPNSVSSTSGKPIARVTPNIQLPSTTDSDDTEDEIDELLNQAQQNQDILALETERVHAHLHALRSQREAQSSSQVQGHTRSRSQRGQGRQQPQQQTEVRSALRALHQAQEGSSNNDAQVVNRPTATMSPPSGRNRRSHSPSQTDESALQQRISRMRHSNRRIHQQTPDNRPATSTPNSQSSSHSSGQDNNSNGSNRSLVVSGSRAGSSRTASQGAPPSHQEVEHTDPVLQVSNNNLSPRHNARLMQNHSRQAERTRDTAAENMDTPGSLSPVTRGRQTRRQHRELLAQAGPFQRSFSGRNAELARAGGQHVVRPRSGSVPRREDLPTQSPSQGQRRSNESIYEKLARIRPQLIRVPGVLLVDIQAGRIVVTVSPDRSNVADITLFMTQNDIPMNEYICGVLARQYRNSRPTPPVVTVP